MLLPHSLLSGEEPYLQTSVEAVVPHSTERGHPVGDGEEPVIALLIKLVLLFSA